MGKPNFFLDDLLFCCKFYTSHGHSLFDDMEEENITIPATCKDLMNAIDLILN